LLKAYAAFEAEETDGQQAQAWAMMAGDVHVAAGKYDEALAAYERVFVAHSGRTYYWHQAQERIVEALRRKGDYAGALSAGRVLMDAAWDRNTIVSATRTTAELLKALDGHVGRANELLNYQRFGPAGEDGKAGTKDDLNDPLADVPYPKLPQRERALAEARTRAGDDATASRFRAATFTYTGHPTQALKMYLDAFARATAREFQSAGYDMIVVGARAVRGHAVGLETFFDFVNHGPNGPDGRKGTADDLDDPFAPLLK
jgi:tetratricopeptide (TPR) repeat protein